MFRAVVFGALLALAALAGAGYFAASFGLIPANADEVPPALEKWMARKALHAAIGRQALKTRNPVALTDANLLAGVKLYAVDCAVCHGGPDGKSSDIARGLYQRAPQLAKYGVEGDEDGEIEWVVRHGIRMTGMPGFRESLTQEEIWKVVLFLKNMDSLTPAAQKAWDAVPSQRRKGGVNS